MRVAQTFAAMMLGLGVVACGDHYEGGGRRDQVPTEETSQNPGVGLGDGMSTQGGASSVGGEAGQGGAFPFPFGGSAGSGATGG